MNSQTHKAHRPAQSGAKAEKKKSAKGKGKEKQHGFNEKVRAFFTHFVCFAQSLRRPLRPSRVGGQIGKVGARQSATKLVFMSPLSTARRTTSLRLS